MDELVDILDKTGNVTGKTAMKSLAHAKGWFHPTIHVWLYTKDGKILIQQRGKDKDTHPLLWDVSVAGHIGAGEDIEASAIREVEEEIGLSISEMDLQKIGVFKSVHKHREDLVDREFHHTFLCELKLPLENLQKQESEVEQLDLIPLIQFSEETRDLANVKKYVTYKIGYYQIIAKEIRKRL
jgi:isopentenyldiphosphate isomerase